MPAWLAVAASVVLASPLAAQGVRSTLTPSVQHILWHDDLGMADATLPGIGVALDFGSGLSLRGFGFARSGIETELNRTGLQDTSGNQVGNQGVDLLRYGATLDYAFGHSRLVPFLQVGGGVLRFDPDEGARTSQVTLALGGGIRMDVTDRLRAELMVQDVRFRMDRYLLAPGGLSGTYPTDAEARDQRDNLAISVGLGYALGGRNYSASAARSSDWSFAAVRVEPYAGELKFSNDAFSDQALVGLRAGVDFGPFVGVRGFYWRGATSGFGDTDPIAGYGGEAQFNLNTGNGLAPFLVAGAGRLNFLGAYRDANGVWPADETFLSIGGGVGLRLTEQLRLNLTARDYILGQMNAGQVSSTDDITHNLMLSAGVSYAIGNSRSAPTPTVRPVAEAPAPVAADTAQPRPAVAAKAAPRLETRDLIRDTLASGFVSAKSATIPIPSEGEIYIRYGTPRPEGGIAAGMVREREPAPINRETLRQELRSILRDEMLAASKGPAVESPTDSVVLRLRSDSLRAALAGAQRANPDSSLLQALMARMDSLVQQRRELDSLRVQARVQAAPAAGPDSSALMYRALLARIDTLAQRRPGIDSAGIQRLIRSELERAPAPRRDTTGSAALTEAQFAALSGRLQARIDTMLERQAQRDLQQQQFLLQQQRQATPAVTPAPAQPALDERRLEAMIDDRVELEVRRRMAELDNRTPQQIISPADPQVVVVQPGQEGTDSTRVTVVEVPRRSSVARTIQSPSAYTGFGLERPKQWILGGRVDLGQASRKVPVHVVPELAFGFGGGTTSLMAALNVEYRLPSLALSRSVTLVPVTRLGLGIITFSETAGGAGGTEGVLNFAYGFSADFGTWSGTEWMGQPRIFLEHQGIDLFDLNRLLLGAQWGW